MEYMGMAGVAAISVIAWLVGETVKLFPLDNRWIPVICGICGSVLGIAGMYVMPDFPAAVGIVSGLAATGADQIGKQFRA